MGNLGGRLSRGRLRSEFFCGLSTFSDFPVTAMESVIAILFPSMILEGYPSPPGKAGCVPNRRRNKYLLKPTLGYLVSFISASILFDNDFNNRDIFNIARIHFVSLDNTWCVFHYHIRKVGAYLPTSVFRAGIAEFDITVFGEASFPSYVTLLIRTH